jgi:hypothetical protein
MKIWVSYHQHLGASISFQTEEGHHVNILHSNNIQDIICLINDLEFKDESIIKIYSDRIKELQEIEQKLIKQKDKHEKQ